MEQPEIVSFDDFSKLDFRVGKVKEAKLLENSRKLIRLSVDFGGDDQRNILAGLMSWIGPEWFEGKSFVFVYNLASRKMAGEESNGMLLCVDGEEGPYPIEAPEGSRAGDKVK